MTAVLRQVLADPGLPEHARDPANWPEPLRREYGDDNGKAAAAAHREALVRYLRRARQALDEFAPDVVVIWGDDQYENFKEDIIPPFCILAYDPNGGPNPLTVAGGQSPVTSTDINTGLDRRGILERAMNCLHLVVPCGRIRRTATSRRGIGPQHLVVHNTL